MRRITPLLSIVIVLGLCVAVQACPACKDSVPNSDAASPGNVSAGMNNSVYLMLGAFFATLGMVGYVTVKAVRTTVRPMPPQYAFPVIPKEE